MLQIKIIIEAETADVRLNFVLLILKTLTWRAFRSIVEFLSEVLIPDTLVIWTVIRRMFSIGSSAPLH